MSPCHGRRLRSTEAVGAGVLLVLVCLAFPWTRSGRADPPSKPSEESQASSIQATRESVASIRRDFVSWETTRSPGPDTEARLSRLSVRFAKLTRSYISIANAVSDRHMLADSNRKNTVEVCEAVIALLGDVVEGVCIAHRFDWTDFARPAVRSLNELAAYHAPKPLEEFHARLSIQVGSAARRALDKMFVAPADHDVNDDVAEMAFATLAHRVSGESARWIVTTKVMVDYQTSTMVRYALRALRTSDRLDGRTRLELLRHLIDLLRPVEVKYLKTRDEPRMGGRRRPWEDMRPAALMAMARLSRQANGAEANLPNDRPMRTVLDYAAWLKSHASPDDPWWRDPPKKQPAAKDGAD